jgi:hypothetical protein
MHGRKRDEEGEMKRKWGGETKWEKEGVKKWRKRKEDYQTGRRRGGEGRGGVRRSEQGWFLLPETTTGFCTCPWSLVETHLRVAARCLDKLCVEIEEVVPVLVAELAPKFWCKLLKGELIKRLLKKLPEGLQTA